MEKLYKHVRIIFWLMVVISLVEIANKTLFIKVFLPSPSIFGKPLPTIYRSQNIEISATFINTIDFSFFMIALSCFYIIYTKRKVEKIIVFITSLVLLFLSFSTASLLCMVLAGVLLFGGKSRFLIIGFLILVTGMVVNPRIMKMLTDADSIGSFIKVSNDYSRLGFFTKLMPQFLRGDPKDVFFGMGLDTHLVDDKLSGYRDIPLMLTFGGNNVTLLKDVYWLGIIITEGIIVLFLYIRILYLLYSRSKKSLSGDKKQFPKVMIFVVVFLGLFNQVLDVKSFSFCFWTMAGIMINYGCENRDAVNLQRKYLQAGNCWAEKNLVNPE